MNFLDRFKFAFGTKESQARVALSLHKVGRPVMTPANYESFAKRGYSKNVIIYSAISKITTSCKGVRWALYKQQGNKKVVEIETHPLLDLISKPNPLQAQSSFFESVIGFKLIAGNSYIEKSKITSMRNDRKVVKELWAVRPDKMRVVPAKTGYPLKYAFMAHGVDKYWDVDQVTLKSDILHWKSFNPLDDWYGLSALEAAMLSMDQNNAGQKWNLAMMQNSATPSGVLQMQTGAHNPRGTMDDSQYKRLKAEFDEWHSGARNAGRPLILEGGLNWSSISLSPKDMEFLKSKEVTGIDLCIALGVPPEIMGLGQKTFSNYKEAKLSFWEETNLPILDDIKTELNEWLVPEFEEEGLYLDYDKDDIEALQYRREQRYASLQQASFLKINEKRVAVGYDEIEGGDVLDALDVPLDNEGDTDESDADNSTNNDDSGDSNDNDNTSDSDSESNEDRENDSDNEDGDDKEFEWKSINLVNANERRKSWKRQNRMRKRIARSFERELQQDFRDLTKGLTALADDLKNSDPKVIEFALVQKINDELPSFEKSISRNVRYTLEVFGGAIFGEGKALGILREQKANLKFDQFVEEYIKRQTGEQIKTITSTSEKDIRRIIKEWTFEAIEAGDSIPELSKYIGAEFEDLSPGRARTIARTEVQLASNNGSREAVKSLGVPGINKEWVSAQDSRVRDGGKRGHDANHEKMNGVSIPLDDKFNVPPDTSMDGPGDTSGGADQVINCRCVLTYKQVGQQNG